MTTPSLPDALRACIEAADMAFGIADEPMATGSAYRCAALIRQHGPALEALLRERPAPAFDMEALRRAARDVCWFDWSGNDCDAVEAICRLRDAIAASHREGIEQPQHCPTCQFTMSGLGYCVNCPSHPADKPSGQAVTDAQIEAALDTKVGLDHTLRSLIRGDTVAVGWSKADVVRKLLEALAPEPTTAGDAVEGSEQESDLHYAELAEAFLRKMDAMGPITPPEAIALRAVITRLRRYAKATPAAAVPVGLRDRFVSHERNVRTRTYAEALYWLDQYRQLAKAMLAASPADPLPASEVSP